MCAELQRQLEIKEALQHVRIEKNKNERLVSDMNKLISSVETRKYEIYSNPEVSSVVVNWFLWRRIRQSVSPPGLLQMFSV